MAVLKMFEYGRRRDRREARAAEGRPRDQAARRPRSTASKLDDIEFLLFFLLLIDAGGDTTRNLLSAGLIALLENPDQLAWLMADLPARLPSAREELLRWHEPGDLHAPHAPRTMSSSAGEQIREGDKVVMYFGSANRDPEKFERPDALDLSRTPNEHIAFGTGPHGCLGQHIARIEIDAMLIEVLTRMQRLRDRRARRNGCRRTSSRARRGCR